MNDSPKISPSSRTSDEVQSFLQKLAATPLAKCPDQLGRLIFAMDATASREPTWSQAQRVQMDMFQVAAELGGLAIQLCYYRGAGGFEFSPWLTVAEQLRSRMAKVECVTGLTQIGRVLSHALLEGRRQPIPVLVFIGDCVEEDPRVLSTLAGRLGLTGIKAFVFQEGDDPLAQQVFREIARLSGGAYCRFDAGSARQLRELLTAVAAYAAGGYKALDQHAQRQRGLALRLSQELRKP
jgi:hypothetical protein